MALTRPLGRAGAGWMPSVERPPSGNPDPGLPDRPPAGPAALVDLYARAGADAARRDGEVEPASRRAVAAHRPAVPRRAAAAALVLAVLVALGVVARAVLSDVGQQLDPTATTVLRTPGTAGHAGPRSATARPGASAPAPGAGVWPGGRSGDSGSGPADPGAVVVDVVGHVARPGLARLPPGARVADAIAAAGGLAPGAAVTRVNLARRLADGEQLVVPGAHDPPPGAGSGGSLASTGGGPVSGVDGGPGPLLDLNAAGVAELDTLPGVGPVTAGRIIAWRTQHQRFTRVEELGEVPGIGPKLVERLRPLVRV
jgi:competence protein ComEA